MTPQDFQNNATAWLNAIGAVLPLTLTVGIAAVGVAAGIWAAITTRFQQKQIDSNTKRLDSHDVMLAAPPQTTVINQPTVIETPAPDPEATEPGTPQPSNSVAQSPR